MSEAFQLTEDLLHISDVSIRNRDAVAFLSRVSVDDQEATIVKALEIGLFCLERGQNTQDTEFVKRQIQGLLHDVEISVGNVGRTAETALIGKIGTENGQVLAPIKSLVDTSTATIKARLDEVKSLLSNELDPRNAAGTLGVALGRIRLLLDPKQEDSVQSSLTRAMSMVTDPNGTLATTVRSSVVEAVKPLKDEVDTLSRQLVGAKLVEDALANTPGKGKTFEELIADDLAVWSRAAGARIERVGEDNQPGDFLVDFVDEASEDHFRIVVETRDRQTPHGRQKISQDLPVKFRYRKAHAAVHCSKTVAGFAKEIGEWAEGHCDAGPWVACTHEYLTEALRFVRVQHRIRTLREAHPDVDTSLISAQSSAIQNSLGRIKTIKSKVTNLLATATDIQSEADSLKSEVSSAIGNIEAAIRAAKKSSLSEISPDVLQKPVLEPIAI